MTGFLNDIWLLLYRAALEFLDENTLLVLHVCKKNCSASDERFVLSVNGTDWFLYQLKAQLDTRSCFLKFIDHTNMHKHIHVGLFFEINVIPTTSLQLSRLCIDFSGYFDALILRNCSVKVCQLCIIMNEKTA